MNAAARSAYRVGQQLWWVPRRRGDAPAGNVEITRVGSRWLSLRNGSRADVETLSVDSGGHEAVGAVYLSEQHWREAIAATWAWLSMWSEVSVRMEAPRGVSAEDIKAARVLLGLPEQKEG